MLEVFHACPCSKLHLVGLLLTYHAFFLSIGCIPESPIFVCCEPVYCFISITAIVIILYVEHPRPLPLIPNCNQEPTALQATNMRQTEPTSRIGSHLVYLRLRIKWWFPKSLGYPQSSSIDGMSC